MDCASNGYIRAPFKGSTKRGSIFLIYLSKMMIRNNKKGDPLPEIPLNFCIWKTVTFREA